MTKSGPKKAATLNLAMPRGLLAKIRRESRAKWQSANAWACMVLAKECGYELPEEEAKP